jgi:L-alanine-DL-glutamate epimerase-like enolase superfamily enzyme
LGLNCQNTEPTPSQSDCLWLLLFRLATWRRRVTYTACNVCIQRHDEHLYTTHAFRDFLAARAVDIVQVDVCRIGGITPWLEVAAMANAQGVRMSPHCGDLMQVHQHLVLAIPNSWHLEVIPLWDVGPFKHQIRIEKGSCLTPTEPGASADFTTLAMDKFRVG